jgi:hypothetical protein
VQPAHAEEPEPEESDAALFDPAPVAKTEKARRQPSLPQSGQEASSRSKPWTRSSKRLSQEGQSYSYIGIAGVPTGRDLDRSG